MPSDVIAGVDVAQVCQALAPAQRVFTAACEAALAQGEAWWASAAASNEERAARVGEELGRFAEGRIDPARFSALFAPATASAPDAREPVTSALSVLRDACASASALTVSVEPGGSLPSVVAAALAKAGRAFAAARLLERVRTAGAISGPLPGLDDLPFHAWTRAERRCAPPLVVTIAGADLHPGALADYADGRQKIVLVVSGPCAPAPLVRLVTPGTLVMQTDDVAAVERAASFDGPAVVAIVPESAALFTHDPAGGAESWQRMSIQRLPSTPLAPVPGMSAWQLREDLRQLEALAAAPVSPALPPGAAPVTAAPDAVDKLASWLLGQSDLSGLT